MGVGRARHGDGVGAVLQAIAGLVLNGRAGGLLLHVGREAAALNHEAVDDAVEDRAVVMAVPGVLEKVGDRVGGGLGVEFQGDGAEIGVQFDHLALSFGGGGKNWAGEGRGQR